MANTKVYKMKFIMGRTPNYDQNGKLKNKVMTPKYTGERELTNLLENDNYKSLGVCEILCIDCYDSIEKDGVMVINKRYPQEVELINKKIKDGTKTRPKTELEILREQVAALTERLDSKDAAPPVGVEDVLVDLLLPETRGKLESKANELGISFRSNIGNQKLFDKIKEVDPEFKL